MRFDMLDKRAVEGFELWHKAMKIVHKENRYEKGLFDELKKRL